MHKNYNFQFNNRLPWKQKYCANCQLIAKSLRLKLKRHELYKEKSKLSGCLEILLIVAVAVD